MTTQGVLGGMARAVAKFVPETREEEESDWGVARDTSDRQGPPREPLGTLVGCLSGRHGRSEKHQQSVIYCIPSYRAILNNDIWHALRAT